MLSATSLLELALDVPSEVKTSWELARKTMRRTRSAIIISTRVTPSSNRGFKLRGAIRGPAPSHRICPVHRHRESTGIYVDPLGPGGCPNSALATVRNGVPDGELFVSWETARPADLNGVRRSIAPCRGPSVNRRAPTGAGVHFHASTDEMQTFAHADQPEGTMSA